MAKEWGLVRPIASQPAYNLLDRRAERELIPMARTYDIAVTPWSALAQGFLAGKYQRDGNAPADARLSTSVSATQGDHFRDAAFDVTETLSGSPREWSVRSANCRWRGAWHSRGSPA